MTCIHLFGGEKGGVGKSIVCLTAVAFLLERTLDFALFDADRSNADVLRIYGEAAGCRSAIFSEAEKFDDAANGIFNAALDGQRVLVNLPAQAMPALSLWIKNNDLLDMADDEGVSFVSWFVSDCGLDSLKLFEEGLDRWGDRMKHIFVANYGMTERWDRLRENKALMQRMRELKVTLIKFPKFVGRADRDLINDRSLTFEQAVTDEQQLEKMGRRRTKKFLKEAYEQFETTGVFNEK